MSSTLDRPELVPATFPETLDDGPSAALLVDRLPERWKFSPVTAGFAALLSVHCLILSFQPLYHAEVWEHLAEGRMTATSRALPKLAPYLNLAAGVETVQNSWLAQTGAYLLQTRWGLPAVQFLQTALATGCLLLLCVVAYRRTGSVGWTVACLGAFYLLNWFQFAMARPQMAGLLAFVALVMSSLSPRWHARYWLLVPLLFAAWANVHGSFCAGLAWLACLAVGRGIDIWRRSGRFTSLLADTAVRRLVMLLELAALATLLNPYGFRLYSSLLAYFRNPNLRDMLEWDPLQIRTLPGMAVAVVAVAMVALYRWSPRRISAVEIVAHFFFGGLALWCTALLPWWSVIAVASLIVHGGALAAGRLATAGRPARAGKWTVITFASLWIAFGFSPLGGAVLHGRSENPRKSISDLAPVELAEYLHKHPPRGQIFASLEMGDYLAWAGPTDLKLFATSRVETLPREVWKAYLAVNNGSAAWKEQLDRYSVNTLIVDKAEQASLLAEVKDDPAWKRDYEDRVAVMYLRKQPL